MDKPLDPYTLDIIVGNKLPTPIVTAINDLLVENYSAYDYITIPGKALKELIIKHYGYTYTKFIPEVRAKYRDWSNVDFSFDTANSLNYITFYR